MKKILLFSVLTIFLNSCSVDVETNGCTDPYADNYNPVATLNDGSSWASLLNAKPIFS